MSTITTLRPSATTSGSGWTPSAGTLHGVTSDDNDATYASWGGGGSAMVLATPADSPPAGERRHLVRVRARGEDGSAWWAVRLANGTLVGGAAATFPSTPDTVSGSWGAGAPPDGSTVLSCYVTGQFVGVKINELFLDVDTREAPTFTPQVVDGSGAVTVTIADTATPTIQAASIDLDDLPPRQYRYWVTSGATIVWDTGIVSGPAAPQQTTPLDNGSYTAHLMVWSTLGENTENPSDEETVAFTLTVGEIPVPAHPVVTADPPIYSIEVCAPLVEMFDGEVGYVEIQRVDCAGTDDESTTTVAILGPLETDECATWEDYTLPRTGLGADCDHEAEECCSYYRARTVGRVDDAIQVSAWSDSIGSGLDPSLSFMWPSTDASIPSGWDRVTALDGKYVKGTPDASTHPGSVGGSTSHLHANAGHTHDTTHGHTSPTPTSAGTGAASSTPGTAGTTAIATTHTHSRPSTNSSVSASGSTAIVPGEVNNDLDRVGTIWIRPDGTPTGVPDGAAALMGDIAPSGWSTYANATGRYPKGPSTGADGGTTAASVLDNHTHSIPAHTHTGSSHSHGSAATGTVSSNLTLNAGPTAVLWQTSHSHPITIGTSNTAALASGGSGTSGASSAGTNEPPYRTLRVRQNTSGVPDLPIGIIAAWRGSLGSLPSWWQLCDGTNGTPDMFGRYPKGATASIGSTGGSLADHSHTTPSHSHTTSGHVHTSSTSSSGATTANVSTTATVSVSTGTHTHATSDVNTTTPTVGNSTSNDLVDIDAEPYHQEVAFVQLMSTPEEIPGFETFCLEWTDDQHLLRTMDEDGPLWAPVVGIFTWDVERPFTASTGVNGTRFVTSNAPGQRNMHMTAAVESEADLQTLLAILARPLVLISPSDSTEVWGAPVAGSVNIIKVGRIRQVSADFIGTGPQPEPQLEDVGA